MSTAPLTLRARNGWHRTRNRLPTLGAAVFVLVVSGAVLYPLAMVLDRPLAEFGDLWARARTLPRIGDTVRNTVLLALCSVVLAVVAGVALAYAAASLTRRLALAATVIAVFPLLIPPIAAGMGWVFVLSPDIGYGNQLIRNVFFMGSDTGPFNIYTLWGIILVPSLYQLPYVFLFVSTALRGLDPAVEDAARVSGASWLETQRRVVLPSIRPSIAYSVVIILLLALGQFVMVLLFGRNANIDVITTEMFRAANVYPASPELAAFLAIPLILTAVALVWLQRRFVGAFNLYQGVGKGVSRFASTRRWPFVVFIVYGTLAIIPPLVGLAITSLSPFWSREVDVSAFSFDNFTALWENERVRRAARNSLTYASTGTVAGLLVCTTAAVVITRVKGRIARFLDYIINLPLGIPAVIIGLAIFLAYAVGPVGAYGSRWLFILAYVILLLPHGTRMMMSGLSGISRDLENAARVCGAGAFRTIAKILFPMLRRSLAAASLIMFVLMFNEFAVSVFIATSGNQVLMTQLYNYWESGIYPQVAAIALVMSVLSIVGSLAMFRALSGRR